MKKKPNPKGARFAALLHASPYKSNEFAALLGYSNPQNMTNWKVRGVPPSHAIVAAEILGCQPSEISDIAETSKADPASAEINKLKSEIKNSMDQVLNQTNQLSKLRMIAEQVGAYTRLKED